MGVPINLTPNGQPVTVTGTGYLPGQNVLDLPDMAQYDVLDLEVGLVGISGVTSPSFAVSLYTSMQNDVDDQSWLLVNAINSTAFTTAPSYAMKTFNMGFLRYLRLNVTSYGTGGSMTFWVRGIARKYGGA